MSFNKFKHQFGRVIKIFHSYNTKKYFSIEFFSFLSLQSILHQSTCHHAPKQSGIEKRKNRHLIKTAHSLMLNTNVPLHNWGDSVLTTCVLIKKLSSSYLENQNFTPLFFQMTLYFMSLYCTYFVHYISRARKTSCKGY